MSYEWDEERLGVGSTLERFVGHIGVVAFSTGVFVMLGLLYLAIVKAEYTAEATVFLTHDSDRLRNEELIQIELDTHRSLMLADSTLSDAIAMSNVEVAPQDSGIVAEVVDSIRRIFSRDPLTHSANATLSSDIDSNSLIAIRQNLSLEQVERSRLLTVSYTDQDAQTAVRFVNSLVQLYSETSNYYTDDLRSTAQPVDTGTSVSSKRAVEPVKLASVSNVTISPSVGLVLSVSMMLGILFGVAIAIRREFMRIL